MQEREYIQEDEIDLRELFKTIWDKRKFIAIFTLVVTILAIIYAMSKTPIYEARALLEIGNYKSYVDSSNSNRIMLDNSSQLEKKLNVLFIDSQKNIKKDASISSISTPKKAEVFLEIVAEAKSNELATKEIQEVIEYVQKEHQKILDDVKRQRELEVNNIELKINNILNNEMKLVDEKIHLLNENINSYQEQLVLINDNFEKIKDSNPSLAALRLIEKRDLANSINAINFQLMEMRDKKEKLKTTVINELREKKVLIASLLLPHNYKNSEVVGKILTNDNPIKPKKTLIVVVAFVTGFILSIFLVFFLQFIAGFKEEKKND